MGMGVLGADSADILQRLGFDVAGWARHVKDDAPCPVFAGPAALPAFLRRTDILVVLLPLTAQTRAILNRPLFEELARDGVLGGPILINAGRGGLQNEADLVSALRDGTLKAASLDVFEPEPLPAQSPFWAMPNVYVTPHVAADSEPDSLVGGVMANIARHQAGEELQGLVSRDCGY
jgi:glyoxylate/hydroxypyruvate reductase A